MKKTLALFLALVMLTSLLAGCGSKQSTAEAAPAQTQTPAASQEETTAQSTQDPIKVAVVGPLTGSYSEYGIGMEAASQVAVDQWNAKGGINGRSIELVSYDEKGEREEGLAIAQLITGEGDFYGVVGHFMSIMLVGQLYGDARMPMIAATASAEGFSAQSDCTFRLNATIKTETAAMLVCADAVGKQKLGVVYLNDDWGNKAYGTLQGILEESNPNGYEIVAAEPILGGDMDYSPVISNLKAAGAETVLMFCYYDSVVPFSIKAAAAYPELKIVCGGNCYNETFIEVGGKDVEGCLAPTVFDANASDAQTQAFVSDYAALTNGGVPSYLSAQAYDAMNVLLEAIESTGGELDREKIISAVANNTHVGVTGSCAFDENRDAARDFFAMKVENGTWTAY